MELAVVKFKKADAEFGRSRSRRWINSRVSKNLGALGVGTLYLGMGPWLTNWFTRQTLIALGQTARASARKYGTSRAVNDRSIGCLWLPISDPQWPWIYILYCFQDTARYCPKLRNYPIPPCI